MKVNLTGPELLNDSRLNKGTAFTGSERDAFALHGLLPPHIGNLEEQRTRRRNWLASLSTPIEKYRFMRDLQDSNETLFYSLITHHVEETLPIVYTPTVGEACQQFSEIWRKPRGLFPSYPNKDRIEQILSDPRYDAIRCIVVSDGERILGLGDQGAGGMGIPIGKMALYTALGGIRPEWCLPILLDVGTDNEERLADPLYIGWRNKRVRGTEYEDFVDRFVSSVKRRWPHVLLQWEDFAGGNAAKFLACYRNELCTFNDDIQGTAAVATATLLSAINVTGLPLTEQRIAVLGFGGAGIGISQLIVSAMRDAGLGEKEARSRFYALDRHGLLVEGGQGVRPEQEPFARRRSDLSAWRIRDPTNIGLVDVIRNAKPTVLIGVSGQPGAFTDEAIRAMASYVERPIVFPLSNPVSRCEATPQQIVDWTEGRALIGTGSPFPPASFQGRPAPFAQTNNSYIFPGLALGIISSRARHVSDAMIKAATLALAELVPTRQDKQASLLPPLKDIRAVSQTIARAVGLQAIKDGLAEVDEAGLQTELAANFWEPVYEAYEHADSDSDAGGVRKSVGRPARPSLHPTTIRMRERTHQMSDVIIQTLEGKHGIQILHDPEVNKSTAFTEAERQALGLVGLLPDMTESIETQRTRVLLQLKGKTTDLERFIYLMSLLDTNETLFYRTLMSDPARFLEIVYDPTIGEACLKFDQIFRRPRGMYLSITHKGRVKEVLRNWPVKDVRFICVTNGGRVLGLGDLGANGMGIPIGKLQLYTAAAGVPPEGLMPMYLDAGTNNETYLSDPLYLGLRQHRLPSEELYPFVDEFVAAVQEVFPKCCIHFEDWTGVDAIALLARYRNKVSCYNDDIQGTAGVVLAGLINALKITGGQLKDQRILFLGAGSAAIGLADLFVSALGQQGVAPDVARRQVRMFDTQGLVVAGRPGLVAHKRPYAHKLPPSKPFNHLDPASESPQIVAAIEDFKPTALIGVSGKALPVGAARLFSREVVEAMARFNARPIIFALSNPTEHHECLPEQAYAWTGGKAVYAGGVQLPPVHLDGQTYLPSQANNLYIFPAVSMAIYATNAKLVTDEMFIEAAHALADQVTPEQLKLGMLFPPQSNILEVETNTAARVAELIFNRDLARVERPKDIHALIESHIYRPGYAAVATVKTASDTELRRAA